MEYAQDLKNDKGEHRNEGWHKSKLKGYATGFDDLCVYYLPFMQNMVEINHSCKELPCNVDHSNCYWKDGKKNYDGKWGPDNSEGHYLCVGTMKKKVIRPVGVFQYRELQPYSKYLSDDTYRVCSRTGLSHHLTNEARKAFVETL